MDRERWEQVQAIFHRVADLPTSERNEALDTLCGADETLRGDVAALLSEDRGPGSMLDGDAVQVARQMLGDALPEPPARNIGPYRIRRMLGEGGMGVVYLAERDDLSTVVAIKVLRDAWLSPARRERFAAEQRTLAQLNHPSIARLYDAGTLADGTPWFVMEYVDGLPLTAYCRAHESGTVERLQLFRAVCEAVQYAHEHAVIHRDLKPSNILVKADGSVRLLDFGIAKQLDPHETSIDQTRTGLRPMTPAYAAPEQIRGERVSVQTDVYSLGVILYELLAGRLPFDLAHKSAAEAETMITTEDPVKPSTVAHAQQSTADPQVRGRPPGPPSSGTRSGSRGTASWPDLDVLCLTSLRKDPKRRYVSAAALIRDTDHYLKGEPLEARPDTVPYKLGKYLRRKWKSAAGAAALVVATAGVASWIMMRKPVATAPQQTVAVLPFQNESSDSSIDYLRLALADEIATTLSHYPSLAIRPFATSSRYSQADMQRAAREMHVATLVTGHFVKAGGQLEISMESVDAASNRLQWRTTIAVTERNLIGMHAAVASQVRIGLAASLGVVPDAQASGTQPKSPEAYDFFLRSAALGFDPEPNKQATAMLERSVGLDPGYGPAWIQLGRRYYAAARFGGGGEQLMDQFVACTLRGQALDPANVVSVGPMVNIKAERGHLDEAYRMAADLLRRRPNSADAEFVYSYPLRYAGLLDESAKHCDRAMALDRATTELRSCAVVFLLQRNYAHAMDFIRLDAGTQFAEAMTMDALVRQGKLAEARAVRPLDGMKFAGFDVLSAKVQGRPSAEIAKLAAESQPVTDSETNYFTAEHLSYARQKDASLRMLSRAVEGGYCAYPTMDSDPYFIPLRGDREFGRIQAAARACRERFEEVRSAHSR
jgi:serine/threonine protein kinase